MKSRILTLLTLISIVVAMYAQPTISKRTFSVRDGLPANSITAVCQDCHGLIWIATWNGLCCYDGYRFTTFRGEPWGKNNALSTNRISEIDPDSRGNIWLRTYDSGLYLLDTEQCRFFNIKQMLREKYGVDIMPRNIYCLPTGRTWVTDETNQLNLCIDDSQPTNIDSYETWGSKGKTISGTRIRKVEVDEKGREWMITDRGRQSLTPNSSPRGEGNFERRGGTLRDGNFNEMRLAESYVTENNINKHFIDWQNNLWYWSSSGLTLVRFPHSLFNHIEIDNIGQARSLLCRNDGTVLVGGYDGNIAVMKGGQQLGWITERGYVSGSAPQQFSHNIYVLYEDREGRVWIGTKGDGLYVLNSDGHTVSHYRHSDSDRYSISSDNIYDIDQDEKGNIWIATFGGGVNLVEGRESRVEGPTPNPSRTGVESGSLRFIHRDNDMKGYPKEGFEKVRRITHDGHGNILVSTTWGLLVCSNANLSTLDPRLTFCTTRHSDSDTTSLQSNDVLQVLVTRSGNIYVATMGGGIQQIESKNLLQNNLRLRMVPAMNRGAGNALSLTEDKQGNIWVTRESEINRYNIKTGQLEQFEPSSTDETVIMTEAKTVTDSRGAVWAGTTNGVLTFLPEKMIKSNFKPHIVFTNIQFQGEQEQQPLLYSKRVEIDSPDKRSIIISFAALDYNDNYLLHYAYRMDDSDEWNDIGSSSHITFNRLSPGEHTLTVRSTNSDGVWMDNDTEIVIYVQPMLIERLWFRLLLLLVIIGLSTWAVIRYLRHRQHVQEREHRLETLLHQYGELQQQMIAKEEVTPNSRPSTLDSQPSTLDSQPSPHDSQPSTHDSRPSTLDTRPIQYHLSEPEIVDSDEEMMGKLMQYIEENISDENLRIEDMADFVGLGRTVFYNKVKQLVGVTPSDFLRQMRMERAVLLIEKSKLSFSEIAYSSGFSDPKYFSKCFKKETGMTPSEYRKAKQQSESSD